MTRIGHGQIITTTAVEDLTAEVAALNARIAAPFDLVRPPALNRFDFLFLDLQKKPGALLPETASTVKNLIRLGQTMHDPEGGTDSTIPAAYTYFGQFVDHDITLELKSDELGDIANPGLSPAPLHKVRALKNARTATLDLDSVYGPPAPRVGEKLQLGTVTPIPGAVGPILGPVPGKDTQNDVPRKPRSPDPLIDREALIGDARNDENLIVAQMQVAFLRAHNALVDRGMTFEQARKALRQHYQWIVLHDFLPRIADPKIVKKTIKRNEWFDVSGLDDPFIPFEFSVGAYRFGHSMVRSRYDHNVNFPDAAFLLLFTFTALKGELNPGPGGPGFDTLPQNWVIQWERFVDGPGLTNHARKIDTLLVEPLFALTNTLGLPEPPPVLGSLGVRNLLRGYLLRLPTGQALAKRLLFRPLSARDLEKAAASPAQKAALKETGFNRQTPLWYYTLAEAASTGTGRLGPVGSTLVAEVLVGLTRRSADSILKVKNWKPTLGTGSTFTLSDIFKLGGNL